MLILIPVLGKWIFFQKSLKRERSVPKIIDLLKMVAVLGAAILIGNWFLDELRKARAQGGPWYQPYLSPPGIMILVAIALPIVFWIITR